MREPTPEEKEYFNEYLETIISGITIVELANQLYETTNEEEKNKILRKIYYRTYGFPFKQPDLNSVVRIIDDKYCHAYPAGNGFYTISCCPEGDVAVSKYLMEGKECLLCGKPLMFHD